MNTYKLFYSTVSCSVLVGGVWREIGSSASELSVAFFVVVEGVEAFQEAECSQKY